MLTDIIDCLVVGGGPAGLTAGIYLGRYRRTVVTIDAGHSRVDWIPRSHNLPGFVDGVVGADLLASLRTQAKRYGATILTGTVCELARDAQGVFSARLETRTIYARTVIPATGVTENPPPISHLADAVKSGVVRTCPICDGYESMGKRIAVIGHGVHAARESLYLRTYSETISLILTVRDASSLPDDVQENLASAGISIIQLTGGGIALDPDGATLVSMDSGQGYRFDVVYSAFGTTAQTQLAAALGARLDEDNRFIVNAHQATSVEGLYAAGDVVRGLNQISVAEGEAAIAATAINNRLPRRPAQISS